MDEEALEMLRGGTNSVAYITEYERLHDARGMGVDQALTFVVHEFRLRHLRYQPKRVDKSYYPDPSGG